jgi:hypothetical protein
MGLQLDSALVQPRLECTTDHAHMSACSVVCPGGKSAGCRRNTRLLKPLNTARTLACSAMAAGRGARAYTACSHTFIRLYT